MSNALDTQCREVFVKAVCAKGRANSEQVHAIAPPRAGIQDVLGCRVVGLRYKTRLLNDIARISGEYELQVWVAFEEESELIRERVEFRQDVHLQDVGDGCLDENPEVLVDVTQGPNVTECGINKNGHIEIVVAFSVTVDVVGRTRLFVQTCLPRGSRGLVDLSADDEEWDWTDDHSPGL